MSSFTGDHFCPRIWLEILKSPLKLRLKNDEKKMHPSVKDILSDFGPNWLLSLASPYSESLTFGRRFILQST